jgi:hypothetical protein
MSLTNIMILTGTRLSEENGVAACGGPAGLWDGHCVENASYPYGFHSRDASSAI